MCKLYIITFHRNNGRIKVFKNISKSVVHYLLDIVSFFIAIVTYFTLRNSSVIKRFTIPLIFFILFVVIDIVRIFFLTF